MAMIALVLFAINIAYSTAVSTCDTAAICNAPFFFAGPETWYDPDDPLQITNAGAINTVAQTSNGNWIVGSVNGGLWKSNLQVNGNLTPQWKAVGDGEVECYSIVAVTTSPANPDVVYAGCGGSTSSEQGLDWNVLNNGDWSGVMVSYNGGERWEMTLFPPGYFVTSILELSDGALLVSTRSSFTNASDGGIWRREPTGFTFKKIYGEPVFNLRNIPGLNIIIASKAFDVNTALVSRDGGKTFVDESNGLTWDGRIPFYSTLAVGSSSSISVVFLGALTVNTSNPPDTFSAIFWSLVTKDTPLKWQLVPNQPQNLDQDSMPKDRMALLVDPANVGILYVAGNAGSVAYRVQWVTGLWTSMIGSDTKDNSAPHVDCRNFAWNLQRQSLLLVSDGGIFERLNPSSPGGIWRSLNGNIGEMEFLSADWDATFDRWIGGAQDNSVQLSAQFINPDSQNLASMGIIGGDGTVTAVDNTQVPPRLFGCVQFLGTSTDTKKKRSRDSDSGLAFVQGDLLVSINLPDFGFDEKTFRYFVQPFSLNSVRPTDFVFFAEASASGPSGWYVIDLPAGLNQSSQIKPPKLLQSTFGGGVFVFVVGGTVSGIPDAGLIIGINGTHFYYKDSKTPLTISKLPTTYATPIKFPVDPSGTPIVGPVSHGKTVSLAVHPQNAQISVITGWPTVLDNSGTESIWLTKDAGKTWSEIIGNLVYITGTIGKSRPSGLIFIPVNGRTAILVGTTRGVYFTWLESPGNWQRLGSCVDFPIVVTMDISYVEEDDLLIVATFGRGIYILRNFLQHLNHC